MLPRLLWGSGKEQGLLAGRQGPVSVLITALHAMRQKGQGSLSQLYTLGDMSFLQCYVTCQAVSHARLHKVHMHSNGCLWWMIGRSTPMPQ